MFGLFKKQDKKVAETAAVLTPETIAAIRGELDQLQQALASTQDSNKLAGLLEQAGLKHAELNEIDQAIECLEQSLMNKKSIGPGYKQLMSLYNQKRVAAARAGDDQQIDYYMSKMDDMRQIAKQVTITGNQ